MINMKVDHYHHYLHLEVEKPPLKKPASQSNPATNSASQAKKCEFVSLLYLQYYS